jgi:hypothetical protein
VWKVRGCPLCCHLLGFGEICVDFMESLDRFSKILLEGFFAVFCVFLGFLGFSWARYDGLSVMRGGAGFAKVCGSLGWLLLLQRGGHRRALNLKF